VELRLNEQLQKASQQLRLFAEVSQGDNRRSMARLINDFSDLYQLNRSLEVTEVLKQRPSSQVFPQFSLSRTPLATYLRQQGSADDYSPLLRGFEDGRPSIYIEIPQADGFLLGRVDLESLRRFLRQFSSAARTPVLLVARDGSVLLSSHDTLRIPAFERDPRWSGQVVRPAMRIGSQRWIPIITPAPSVGAAIVTLVPTQPMEEEQRLILLLLLVACSGSSLLIALKNLRMHRLFIRPIADLAERMHALKSAAWLIKPAATAPAFAELEALESAFEAMTLAIRERERGLQRQASIDDLTGLLNRRELLALLEGLLAEGAADQAGAGLALLFCDLDLFKDINDQFGHATGDLVLRRVAQRIRRQIRSDDLAARMGGDEIVVVLCHSGDPDGAIETAQRIGASIAQPIHSCGVVTRITASIGVTWARRGEDVDSLMARADIAMYRAKQEGRNRVVPFA